jgi:hypothetical protein
MSFALPPDRIPCGAKNCDNWVLRLHVIIVSLCAWHFTSDKLRVASTMLPGTREKLSCFEQRFQFQRSMQAGL